MKNNATSSLAVAMTAASATLTVASGKGALFSNGPVSVFSGGALEVMLVTGIAGDVLTVTRAQEGTTAQAWSIGASVVQGLTANQWLNAVSSRFAAYKAGVTLTAPARATWNPTTGLHPVPRQYADTTYYPSTQPYQPNLGFTPVQRLTYAATPNALNVGWNGSQGYVLYGSSAMYLWTTTNFNPASKAAKGALCPTVGIGYEMAPVMGSFLGSVYVDASTPWVCQGIRSSTGTAGFPYPYFRMTYLHNQ